MGTNCNTRNSI